MIKIGLLSDTHGYVHPSVLTFLQETDEIWHAGDIGDLKVIEALEQIKPVVAVYGNIDNARKRQHYREDERFEREGMRIYMTHIGGYPGRYDRRVKPLLMAGTQDLFVCGHSHILKVMYDHKLGFMTMNPGAAGNHGWHKSITALRFQIDHGQLKQLEVLDVPRSANLAHTMEYM